MSGRWTRWILLVFIPVLVAVYASYPPMRVAIRKQTFYERVARTADEAHQHNVKIGQQYEVPGEVTWRRFLPLALGQKTDVSKVTERRADGTIVEERTTYVEGRVKRGLDVAGGTELLYELQQKEGERLGGAVANTIEILKKRIDPSNVKEYRIQQLEANRILIQVPQATTSEVEQLKTRLEKMGKLEFRLAAPPGSSDPRFTRLYREAEAGEVPEGYMKMYEENNQEGQYFLVRTGDPEITGTYLDPGKLRPTFDRMGQPAVGFEFSPLGARRFAKITETNAGWCLAIILDGVLKSAPVIEERISGSGIIRGRFTQAQVNDMVNVLRAGSLPMDITLAQENTVGPQLGRDSIRKGLLSLAVAGFLVLGFIGVYYLLCGLIADAALILNLVFLLGVLCLLGAALTLPGMAGILLTVGMAVDANVLIFERIREEFAAGKAVRVALRNGYERAFTTIVDANVTTLLTAGILYLVGTGPVKGFAVTLSFGILLSMFTALVLTRLAFETLIERDWLHEFKMLSLVHNPQIRFVRNRRPAYLASITVVVIGMVAFFWRGSRLYDIDFTGGSLVQVSLAKPTPVGTVRQLLAQNGFPNAEVQGIASAGATAAGMTDFGIRIKGTGVDLDAQIATLSERLQSAGLLKEGGKLEATPDGRALRLSLPNPATEMEVRRALGEQGDPMDIPGISTIVADKDITTQHVLVQPFDVSAIVKRRDLLTTVFRALAWAGLQTEDYTIKSVQAGDGGTARLVLDRPLSVDLLRVELARRQFDDLDAEPVQGQGAEFTIKGSGDRIAEFMREFPAGSELQSVPIADVDGLSVSARLKTEVGEADIRTVLEQLGVRNAHVVPLDAQSDVFRLNLGSEPIRRRMRGIFADLAGGGLSVSFEPLEDKDTPEEDVRVKMKLGAPMSFEDVRLYIGAAGIGPYADQMIVGQDAYSPESQVSDLTLQLPTETAGQIEQKLTEAFGEPQPVQKVSWIGSTVAQEMQARALLAVIFASVIIVLYVAVRFHAFRFGVAAVIALVHDILITAGLIALAQWSGVFGDVRINLAMLAAFLTILGYSLNDTIVVFDRIRENMGRLGKKEVDAETIDSSVNQTLSRTILTSFTTFLVVFVLYLLGGSVLQGLALTLMIGVVVGTYSSVFIASPVLLDWEGLMKILGFPFKVIGAPFRLLRTAL